MVSLAWRQCQQSIEGSPHLERSRDLPVLQFEKGGAVAGVTQHERPLKRRVAHVWGKAGRGLLYFVLDIDHGG